MPAPDSARRSQWLLTPKPVSAPRLRLFCFSFAGGGPAVFYPWAQRLPGDVELVAIQLPGRGSHFHRDPYRQLEALLQPLVAAMQPWLDVPFGLFGHSLGALVAFEAAYELQKRSLPEPRFVVVSGGRPPHIPYGGPAYHLMPDAQLISEMRRRGGMPESILATPDLLELLLPTLRADLEFGAGYLRPLGPPLRAPLLVLSGTEDDVVSRAELDGWRAQAQHYLGEHTLRGNHFFIFADQERLFELLHQACSGFPNAEIDSPGTDC